MLEYRLVNNTESLKGTVKSVWAITDDDKLCVTE